MAPRYRCFLTYTPGSGVLTSHVLSSFLIRCPRYQNLLLKTLACFFAFNIITNRLTHNPMRWTLLSVSQLLNTIFQIVVKFDRCRHTESSLVIGSTFQYYATFSFSYQRVKKTRVFFTQTDAGSVLCWADGFWGFHGIWICVSQVSVIRRQWSPVWTKNSYIYSD